MYAVFMEDWQAFVPSDRLTVLRSEDYFQHIRSTPAGGRPPPLAKLWRWLQLEVRVCVCVCVCVTMPAVEEVHYIAVCRHLASACLCVRDVKEGHTLVLVLSAFLRAKDLPIDFFQPSCVCETAKKSTHRSARFFQPSCVRTTGGFGPNERRVSSPSLTAVSALMCEWCVRARVCERRQRDPPP